MPHPEGRGLGLSRATEANVIRTVGIVVVRHQPAGTKFDHFAFKHHIRSRWVNAHYGTNAANHTVRNGHT